MERHTRRFMDTKTIRTWIEVLKVDILLAYARLKDHFSSKPRCFLEIVQTTVNWWYVFAVRFGLMKSATVRFRLTSTFYSLTKANYPNYCMRVRELNNIRASKKIQRLGDCKFKFSHPRGLEFGCNEDMLSYAGRASQMDCYYDESDNLVCEVTGLKFITPRYYGTLELGEIFIDKMYGEPSCEGAVVIDVGAFIGDTPLFFASRGAKRVIAFEPIPQLCETLKSNVALNKFEKTIESRNQAITNYSGHTTIGYLPAWPGMSSEDSHANENAILVEVECVPLSEVIMSLGWVDILKLDCEGCEHKVLREAIEKGSLEHVGMIILEVHSGIRDLIMLLRSQRFEITRLKYCGPNWILSVKRF